MKQFLFVACCLVIAGNTPVNGQPNQKVASGIAALKSGDYPSALVELNDALSAAALLTTEDASQAYFYRGMAIISAHQEALRLRRPPPIADAFLRTCQDLAAASAADDGSWTEEISQLRKELYRPLLSEGIRALNGHDFQRARDYMDCVVSISTSTMDNAYWPAYDMRGQARLALQDTLGAMDDLRRATEVYQSNPNVMPDPLITYVYYRIARLHRMSVGGIDLAIEAVASGKAALAAERAKMSDDFTEQRLEERFSRAKTDIEKLELDMLLNDPERYALAEREFSEALVQNPDDYELLLGFASLLEATDRKRAIPVYEQAIRADPDRRTAYFNLAVMLFNDGAELFTALKDEPDLTLRRSAQELIGSRFAAAVPLFEKAHTLERLNEDALDALIQMATYLKRDKDVQRYKDIKLRASNP
ncbi:MAG: hypothetical protein HOH43_05195 [Candidatus Latescibacteria bacterium]|nr:hypothetical protein [Candidatus Latescibacterota bacterium]